MSGCGDLWGRLTQSKLRAAESSLVGMQRADDLKTKKIAALESKVRAVSPNSSPTTCTPTSVATNRLISATPLRAAALCKSTTLMMATFPPPKRLLTLLHHHHQQTLSSEAAMWERLQLCAAPVDILPLHSLCTPRPHPPRKPQPHACTLMVRQDQSVRSDEPAPPSRRAAIPSTLLTPRYQILDSA